jgi:hypothetical protein
VGTGKRVEAHQATNLPQAWHFILAAVSDPQQGRSHGLSLKEMPDSMTFVYSTLPKVNGYKVCSAKLGRLEQGQFKAVPHTWNT